MKNFLTALCACCMALAACGPSPAEQNLQIQMAVQQTVAALPTDTPLPRPAIQASPTPLGLAGIFCEYEFCIGHPVNIAFYDLSAVQSSQATPSNFSKGNLAAYDIPTVVILLLWQQVPANTTDPQFMLDLILADGLGTRNGNLGAQLVGGMNVTDVQIITNTNLPNGIAAAWICGGRAFAWKALTPTLQAATSLFLDSVRKFRCSKS